MPDGTNSMHGSTVPTYSYFAPYHLLPPVFLPLLLLAALGHAPLALLRLQATLSLRPLMLRS